MSSPAKTTTQASASASAEIKNLRNAVQAMDGLAQDGFAEISAIAKLALAMLEHPDGYRHPERIAQALRTIWGKADDMENCISGEAERVGCNYVDESKMRRYAAQAEARGAA